MYSGITRGLCKVTRVTKLPGLITYSVQLSPPLLYELEIGASVAIDGVCQTVIAIDGDHISFQAMAETLERTTLCDLIVGRQVSVENSLRYGDVIGGHEIAGHVIGTAEVSNIVVTENNFTMELRCPRDWMHCIFSKGYIAVDGSSLTVGETNNQAGTFTIHLIPETLRVTNFANKKIGDRVNIELDFKIQAIVHTVTRMLEEQKLLLPR